MATKFIAIAKIKNDDSSWEEDFDVTSKDTAEQEVKEVVQYYNETLKRGESPREFVELIRVEEEHEEEEPDEDFDRYDDPNELDWEDDEDWDDNYGDDEF